MDNPHQPRFPMQMPPYGTQNGPSYDVNGYFSMPDISMGFESPFVQQPFPPQPSQFRSRSHRLYLEALAMPLDFSDYQDAMVAQNMSQGSSSGSSSAAHVPLRVGQSPVFRTISAIMGSMAQRIWDMERMGHHVKHAIEIATGGPVDFSEDDKFLLMSFAFKIVKDAYNELLPVVQDLEAEDLARSSQTSPPGGSYGQLGGQEVGGFTGDPHIPLPIDPQIQEPTFDFMMDPLGTINLANLQNSPVFQ